jgi:hypothetical protein
MESFLPIPSGSQNKSFLVHYPKFLFKFSNLIMIISAISAVKYYSQLGGKEIACLLRQGIYVGFIVSGLPHNNLSKTSFPPSATRCLTLASLNNTMLKRLDERTPRQIDVHQCQGAEAVCFTSAVKN